MDIATIFQNVLKILGKYWDVFLIEGLTNTLSLSAITVFFGAIFGALLALGKLSRFKVLRFCITAFVEIIRGTPILLQLYFFWIGLPKLVPFELSDTQCIVIALAVNASAFISEIIRAGIAAVDKGQWEAARSIGLSETHVMTHVILPQAVSTSVPAFMANVIFLLKETSVFSAVSLMDLMFTAKDLIGLYYKTPECLFLLVVFYLIILLPVSLLGSWLERRVRYAGFGS